MISDHQLAEALKRLDPREWEVLDLSLRRRVPDEALARIFDTGPSEVARRRAAAIDHLAEELGVQRGEDLGAVLKALLEAPTWEAAEGGRGEGWEGFSGPGSAGSDPLPPAEPERELKTSEVARLFRLTPAPDPLAPQAPEPLAPHPEQLAPRAPEELPPEAPEPLPLPPQPAESSARKAEQEPGQTGERQPDAAPAPEQTPAGVDEAHGRAEMAGEAHTPEPAGAEPAREAAPTNGDRRPREPVLEMLTERPADDGGRARTRLLWALAGGLGVAGLLGAGWVAATQFHHSNGRTPPTAADETRRFLPEKGGPLAAPFPSDPRTASCYTTALLRRPAMLYSRPGARRMFKLPPSTEWGSPRVLSVVRRSGDWLAVLAPELKNGEVGWLQAQRVQAIDCVRWSLHVDLSRRQLFVRRDGHTVRRLRIAIGSKAHPTPEGRFAVTDKLRVTDKGSPYGCCVLALTGHQNKLPPDWPGGDRLAVHATSDLSSIGKPISLGCMRSRPASVRWLIKTVPLGSPMFVRS